MKRRFLELLACSLLQVHCRLAVYSFKDNTVTELADIKDVEVAGFSFNDAELVYTEAPGTTQRLRLYC